MKSLSEYLKAQDTINKKRQAQGEEMAYIVVDGFIKLHGLKGAFGELCKQYISEITVDGIFYNHLILTDDGARVPAYTEKFSNPQTHTIRFVNW